jgi:hypothetical protein
MRKHLSIFAYGKRLDSWTGCHVSFDGHEAALELVREQGSKEKKGGSWEYQGLVKVLRVYDIRAWVSFLRPSAYDFAK